MIAAKKISINVDLRISMLTNSKMLLEIFQTSHNHDLHLFRSTSICPQAPRVRTRLPTACQLHIFYFIRRSSQKRTFYLLHTTQQLRLLRLHRNPIIFQHPIVFARQTIAPLLPYIFTRKLLPTSPPIQRLLILHWFSPHTNHVQNQPNKYNHPNNSSHEHTLHIPTNTTHHRQNPFLSKIIRHQSNKSPFLTFVWVALNVHIYLNAISMPMHRRTLPIRSPFIYLYHLFIQCLLFYSCRPSLLSFARHSFCCVSTFKISHSL